MKPMNYFKFIETKMLHIELPKKLKKKMLCYAS